MVDGKVECLVMGTTLCCGGVKLVGAALGVGGAVPSELIAC